MRSDSEMKGISQRLRPFSHPPLHFPPVLRPAVWIMIDLFQMARRKHPLIFQCFIKKYLFRVVSLGHGRDLSSQFPNGAWLKKGWFSLPHNKINDLQYYFRNESISSVTKWILIGYNETWVWLELFQEACCTRHCQRVAIQLVISQLGQDKPHTVNIPDDESTCSAQLFASFLMLHTISRPTYGSIACLCGNGSRCHGNHLDPLLVKALEARRRHSCNARVKVKWYNIQIKWRPEC